jgi:hypothetical protein
VRLRSGVYPVGNDHSEGVRVRIPPMVCYFDGWNEYYYNVISGKWEPVKRERPRGR